MKPVHVAKMELRSNPMVAIHRHVSVWLYGWVAAIDGCIRTLHLRNAVQGSVRRVPLPILQSVDSL